MSTTVTTTVTTTTTFITYGAALGLLLTLALIVLMITKEVASATTGAASIRWGRVLNVGVAPLLVSFACFACVKVMSVL
jgi:large-conductance mechanosensitive channel